jgi:hypothetical protein
MREVTASIARVLVKPLEATVYSAVCRQRHSSRFQSSRSGAPIKMARSFFCRGILETPFTA